MSITLRNIKGSPLTHEEMDENFSALTSSLGAGDGLTGGGFLTSEVEFNVGQGDGISVSPDSVGVNATVARTGSNVFVGDQTITGSVYLTGSLVQEGVINLLPTTSPLNTSDPQSFIYVTGSEGDLYFSQHSSRGVNTTKLRWLEGNLYSGILSGGVISGTPGGTTFNVSAGSGIIVEYNASISDVDLYPIITPVKWNDFTNITPTFLSSVDTTWLYIDKNGNLKQQGTVPTDAQLNSIISLGAIIHPNNSTINLFKTFPLTSYGLAQQTYEFIRIFGPIKKSGHVISPGAASLSLSRSSGKAFSLGRNYITDPNDPSLISDPAKTEATIYRYYQSGSEFVTVPNNTTIDPTKYNTPNTATGLSTVAGGQYTIQRVFYFPGETGILGVYYGRQLYNSISAAVENLNLEDFVEIDNTLQQAIFLGYVVVKGNATNLADSGQAEFIQSGNFRSTATSGGGGGSPILTTLNDLSDVTLGGLQSGDLLVYNGAEWENQKNDLQLTGSFSGSFAGVFTGKSATSTTGSFSKLNVTGDTTFDGDLVVTGRVTAEEFHTEFVAASIIYQSGSTKFGDTSDDIHSFTGSIKLLGDITGSSNIDIAGTVDANVYSINGTTVVDSSRNITGSNGLFTGDVDVANLDSSGNVDANTFSIDGSTVIDASENITGASLDVTGKVEGNIIAINGSTVIDSSENITGASLDVSGEVEGNSFAINTSTVIDSSQNITGASLDVTGNADANTFSIDGSTVIDASENITGASLDVTGEVEGNSFAVDGTIIVDASRNFTGSNADLAGNLDVGGNTDIDGALNVLGSTTLGDSDTSDTHSITGITSVTGSFAVDNISLDGQQVSSLVGDLELNSQGVIDIKTNITASGNDLEFRHTGTGNFTFISSTGNTLIENTSFSGDDVTVVGNVAVNGGNLTTTDTTANIFNTNATSLNLAGAATSIDIGSTSGTTSINHNLTVDGNTTLGNADADRVDILGQVIALSGSNITLQHDSPNGEFRIQTLGGTNNKLILSSSGDIEIEQSITMKNLDTSFQSVGYQSGFAGQGFDINFTSQSSAEFDNLTVRGSMRVFELIINQIRATNGSLFVSSVGKVDSVVDLGGGEYALIFDTGSGTVGHGFAENDVIRSQQVDRSAIGEAGVTQSLQGSLVYRSDLTVTSVQDLKVVTASLDPGSTPPSSSFDYVRLGNTTNVNRQGNVYLTSDDNYAPFIDVVDGITDHSDWNNSAVSGGVKVRVGKIDGINSPEFGDLTGYGMWASGSVYLEGSINATGGLVGGWAIQPGYLESNNIRLQSSGSAGGELISIGSAAGMSGNGIFLSGSGDFNLQADTNEYIRKSSGLLDIKSSEFSLSTGQLTISGSSTNGFVSLGTLTDANTVSNTNAGFFVSSSGDILLKGNTADNKYIKVQAGGGVEIKSDDFDLLAGQLALVGNSTNSYIKIGSLTNATTTGTTNSGFYADNSGNVLIKGNTNGTNYLKIDGSGTIDLNSDNFTLTGGSTLKLTNAGGGLLTFGDTVYSGATVAISGSGEAKFGNINVDGRNGGSIFSGNTTISSTLNGLFLSGSGEFNFVKDSSNYLRRVGSEFELAATTASLSGENVIIDVSNLDINTPTFDLTTSNGGQIALGASSPSLTNPGIYLSGSGEFNFEVDDNNRITQSGGTLDLRAENLIAKGDSVEISGSNFHLLNGNITASNVDLSGNINAQTGTIGGFIIDTNLTATSGLLTLEGQTGEITGSQVLFTGGKISGSNLEINVENFTALGNSVEISGSNFHLLNGNITASNVDLSGNINAETGTIGGFSISTDALSSSNFYLSGSATGNEFFISASNFNVKANGDLTASNANITGDIVANNITATTAGNIAGWTIGSNTLSSGDVYLSNDTNEKGLYISSSVNRLQVGEFNDYIPSPTTLSTGTRTETTSTDSKINGYISLDGFFLTNNTGSATDTASIFVPIIGTVNQNDTVIVTQPVEFIGYSDRANLGFTYDSFTDSVTVEIVSGSSNTVVASSEAFLRPTPNNINLPGASKTLQVSFFYTGSQALTSTGDLKAKITNIVDYNRTSTTGTLNRLVDINGLVVKKDTAVVNITNNQAFFYAGENRQFKWTPDELIFKGGELDITDLVVENVFVTSSNTNVIAVQAEDVNQDGLLWGIAANGDPYFAPISKSFYDFDSELRYDQSEERWQFDDELYVNGVLNGTTATFTGDLNAGDISGSTLESSGNTVVRGNLTVLGDTIISGSIDGHPVISPVASDSDSNTNGVVIQNLTVDAFGHLENIGTVDLDNRFVEKAGDTMSGNLILTDKLLSSQNNTDVDTGTEVVATVATSTYDAAFFDFVIKKTTNLRAGTVYAIHDGTNVEFTETSTQDLGDTSDVTLSVDISGGNLRLNATTTSNDWSVKALVRGL